MDFVDNRRAQFGLSFPRAIPAITVIAVLPSLAEHQMATSVKGLPADSDIFGEAFSD